MVATILTFQQQAAMKKIGYWIIASLLAITACEDPNENNDARLVGEVDKKFVLDAADAGLFEVNAGQVASAKASNADIKSYGELMVEDHYKINQELGAVAKTKGLEIPTTLSNEKQGMLDSLASMSGMTFDTIYVNMMVSSHTATVNLFETEAANGVDEELKSWASSRLPVLREHLEKAKALKDATQL
jgi:putative membrane protein